MVFVLSNAFNYLILNAVFLFFIVVLKFWFYDRRLIVLFYKIHKKIKLLILLKNKIKSMEVKSDN